MTPGESIRRFCVECVGSPFEVRACGGDQCKNGGCDKSKVCHFFKYRMGKGRPSVKTIRKVCLWCMGESSDQAKECHDGECALHPYRWGKNPNIRLSEEEKARRVEGTNLPRGIASDGLESIFSDRGVSAFQHVEDQKWRGAGAFR